MCKHFMSLLHRLSNYEVPLSHIALHTSCTHLKSNLFTLSPLKCNPFLMLIKVLISLFNRTLYRILTCIQR